MDQSESAQEHRYVRLSDGETFSGSEGSVVVIVPPEVAAQQVRAHGEFAMDFQDFIPDDIVKDQRVEIVSVNALIECWRAHQKGASS